MEKVLTTKEQHKRILGAIEPSCVLVNTKLYVFIKTYRNKYHNEFTVGKIFISTTVSGNPKMEYTA